MQQAKPKSKKKWIVLGILGVLLLTVVLTVRSCTAKLDDMMAGSIHTATVSRGDITTSISGTGTLSAGEAEELKVPEGVKLEEILVSTGDLIHAGDTLATVDRSSVETAMSEIQGKMERLGKELNGLSNSSTRKTLTAGASGRVKKIYVQADDNVSAAVRAHGALMLISLDGKMKVTLEKSLPVGDTVSVETGDGKTYEGTVEGASGDRSVITLTDNGPGFGEEVTVRAEDGTLLGTGVLEINSQLSVVDYRGTVKTVRAKENQKISAGSPLVALDISSDNAEYTTLLSQREELAQQMQTLLDLYETGVLAAPFDGVVQSVAGETEETEDQTEQEYVNPFAGMFPMNAAGETGVRLVSLSDVTVTEAPQTEETPTEAPAETEPSAPSEPPTEASAPPSNVDASLPAEGIPQPSENEQPSSPAANSEQPVASSEGENISTPPDQEQEDPDDAMQLLVADIPAAVTLAGGSIQDYAGKFAFTLTGQGVTWKGTNDDKGVITFQGVPFAATGSYTFELKQIPGDDPAITYDTAPKTLTVAVTDGDSGLTWAVTSDPASLVFVNKVSGQSTLPDVTPPITLPEIPSFSIPDFSGGSGFSGSTGTTQTETDDAPAYETLFTLSRNEEMTVSVSVDELDILSIQKGLKAQVTIDALNAQVFEGTVTEINMIGSSSGGVSKYTVTVSVPYDERMRINMNTSVSVATGSVENCLWLPENALNQDGTTTFVYTAYDEETGLSGQVPVTTGISDGTNVEITGGLEEGATVYYTYQESQWPFPMAPMMR